MASGFRSFREFYPYYLGEHRDARCRRLHVLGSTLALACIGLALWQRQPWWLLAGLFAGYACAWIGHFVFEKNRPATFRHPVYSFVGDWRMFVDVLRGRVRL
jgi:hypothetical protein